MNRNISIKEYRKEWEQKLSDLYPTREIIAIFNQIVEKWLGWIRLDLALDPNRKLRDNQRKELDEALNRLKKGEPIQYILGEAGFYNRIFKVDENVLIPRPETEELVQWVIEEEPAMGQRILDIGTGSGCIPIALAGVTPGNQFFGVDVSEGALKLARKNAIRNEVKVTFSQVDILNPPVIKEKWDCMLSNPPYIRRSERALMHQNVLKYEPDLALFVEDEDPLLFYRKIIAFARNHLKAGGVVYFEINEFLGKELHQLFEQEGCDEIIFKKDSFAKLRMARIRL